MEFFIDRKFWNSVKKKVSPKAVNFITKHLKQGHIKTDFDLSLPNTRICNGFFEKKFTPYSCGGVFFKHYKVKDFEVIEIELATLKVLIEQKGLSEKIKYCKKGNSDCDFVVEQDENQEFKKNVYERKGFVYFIRNEEIFKIGITDNLLRRFNQLKPDEVLNVVRCSNYESLEKELHKKFKEYRIPQTEYFRLSKNQIEKVNIEMTKGANF